MSGGLNYKVESLKRTYFVLNVILFSFETPQFNEHPFFYFFPGFDKCKAAKRLEILQKKLKLEQKVGHKQQDRPLIKNERVPEACSAGMFAGDVCNEV